ncbi:hypothetical protein CDL12_10025 [Handroanthus impetiginosus]|uniref:C2H2-type domain-containing protein n=1 Tax=Handroanthus impetiginosus TaxID=429701 RepID=A0A2G9HIF7_9LAMI|nr:hypothetical protein CDL12_10025 [Handroanthus impetiginosus]
MDKNQHVCKYCNKIFPCGRSLGGHMRSHLINLSSSGHRKTDEKLPKKKLPPSVNGKSSFKTDFSMENPEKPNKSLKSSEEDTLLQEKLCKECGKSFHSWKALFGHMKCHSVSDRRKLIIESESDYETATPLCKKKRSDRMKRYTVMTTNSSSLNFSPCVSEIDQQEQEEVALSLIILSRDKGDWGHINSFLNTSNNSSEQFSTNKIIGALEMNSKSESLKFKKLKNEKNNLESEVHSPKNLIKESGLNEFEADIKKNKSRKRKFLDMNDYETCQDFEKKSKFTCSICKKAFSSYQALGGHRASHKKFKGCCAPSSEAENSPNQSPNISENKDHECPICFKVFSSGQALGGHKRSHLVCDQSKVNPSVESRDVRNFLDLNLPAPVEEECDDFKPWWKHEPLFGLISS